MRIPLVVSLSNHVTLVSVVNNSPQESWKTKIGKRMPTKKSRSKSQRAPRRKLTQSWSGRTRS